MSKQSMFNPIGIQFSQKINHKFCLRRFFAHTEVTSERRERPTSAERRTESPYHNREPLPAQQPATNADGKTAWNYPGLDLMATGAFWQNYSG